MLIFLCFSLLALFFKGNKASKLEAVVPAVLSPHGSTTIGGLASYYIFPAAELFKLL